MFKVIAVTVLIVTVVGAAGIAVYDNSKPDEALAQNPAPSSAPVSVSDTTSQSVATPDNTQNAINEAAQQPWSAAGVITSIDDTGFQFIADTTSVYVELGPASYWQEQGIGLSVGETVSVAGFTQGGLYHAAMVTKTDGSQIVVRDGTSGQPLWSGSVANGQTAETQVAAEDWITVDGVVTTSTQNSLTMQTADRAQLTLQLGRAGFAADQGVSFAVGDQVQVIGFDSAGQFRAGEIDNLTQGGRLMLLDPNGRPLWAGPGGNGRTDGTAAGTGQSGQNQGNQNGQGQGNRGKNGQGGQGKGYRGGKNN